MTPDLVIIGTLSRKTGSYVIHDPPLPMGEIRKPMASIHDASDYLSPEQIRQREKYESARRTL